jgi:hypothetical protein
LGNCLITRRCWDGPRILLYRDSVCCPTAPSCAAP